MAFDLDDDELKATREMHKLSDKNVANVTKSDIDILKALINVYEAGLPNCDELLDSEVKALKKVLAEREQDKARIKELEEELEKATRQLDLDYVEENFTTKQKVKEGLEKIEDYFDRLNGPDEDIEYIKQIKQELLGGGK